MPTLFPNFLTDESEYAQAEAYWAKIWGETSEVDRLRGGWRAGWFTPAPPKDGNPIFTAVSDKLGKAIRVIQHESTIEGTETEFWLDTYGGSQIEPTAIRELVIACALSVETAQRALELFSSWIVGDIDVDISSESSSIRGFARFRGAVPRWQQPMADPSAPTQRVDT